MSNVHRERLRGGFIRNGVKYVAITFGEYKTVLDEWCAAEAALAAERERTEYWHEREIALAYKMQRLRETVERIIDAFHHDRIADEDLERLAAAPDAAGEPTRC